MHELGPQPAPDHAARRMAKKGPHRSDEELLEHVRELRCGARAPTDMLGIRPVGRREQQRFARRACERMAKLVSQQIASAHR